MLVSDDFEPIENDTFEDKLNFAKSYNLMWATGESCDINKFIETDDPEIDGLYRNIEDDCLLLIGHESE